MENEFDYIWLPQGVLLKNKYLIGRKIAISDLSIAYIGYDLESKEKCVIKEFYPKRYVLRDLDRKTVVCRLSSLMHNYDQARQYFFSEAEILNDIDHKNIVKCEEYFIENGTGYIITKHYNGKTLDKFIEVETEITITGFLEKVFIPLIDTLEYLHLKGIIHRDIKPNNIIITQSGEPILIDFGSAIYYRKIETTKIFITPGFSPLELYSKTARQGRYSDIYSLTATLYYYLCGKAPRAVTERIIEDKIDNIRNYNRIISRLLSKIIMRNLSLDYRKRQASLNMFKKYIYLECVMLKTKRTG